MSTALRPVLCLFCVALVGVGACVDDEVCDDGADNDGDALADCDDPACAFAAPCVDHCGDAVLDDDEACDDGNDVDDDGCSGCAIDGCGDGVLNGVEAGGSEVCDDGNLERGDGCDDRCQIDQCGNGRRGPTEECDDGNLHSGDGCSSRCEQEGNSKCGDGVFDEELGEECDDGNDDDDDNCSRLCRDTRCGDGVVQPSRGEQCEGDVDGGERCVGCRIVLCGNGRVDADEECDDGNDADDDDCAGCIAVRCGNFRIERDEECDDGNGIDGDGCAGCVVEFCGDGVVNAGEGCDDLNEVGCIDCWPVVDDGALLLTPAAFSVGLDFLSGPVAGAAGVVDGRLALVLPQQGSAFLFDVSGLAVRLVTREPQASIVVVADVDGVGPADLVACAGGLIVTLFDDDGGQSFAVEGAPCNAVAVADVDGDGDNNVVTAAADGLVVHHLPLIDVDAVAIEGGFDAGGAGLVAVDDAVVVAAADSRLWQLSSAGLALLDGRLGQRVLAADVDGDGNDDVVSADGVDIDVGGADVAGGVVVSLAFAPLRLRSGDLDDDGRDDVVAVGDSAAVLLLSSRAFAPGAPLPLPVGSDVIVDGRDLIVIGAPQGRPLTAARYTPEP